MKKFSECTISEKESMIYIIKKHALYRQLSKNQLKSVFKVKFDVEITDEEIKNISVGREVKKVKFEK